VAAVARYALQLGALSLSANPRLPLAQIASVA